MALIKVTGKTYQAREMLKMARFDYDGVKHCWYGNEDSLSWIKRISNDPSYREYKDLIAGLKFEEIKKID